MLLLGGAPARAHSGPPYPIVSNQTVGPYRVSVWTDPDATDDGSAAGQFWVTLEPARPGTLTADTRARLSIRALDRDQPALAAPATPVDGNIARQYAALRMDHEGPYAVHVTIDGAGGRADLDARVEATYDLRPPVGLLAVYVLPFLLVGFLWTKLLLRRRRARTMGA
jgi:hypothetical protein